VHISCLLRTIYSIDAPIISTAVNVKYANIAILCNTSTSKTIIGVVSAKAGTRSAIRAESHLSRLASLAYEIAAAAEALGHYISTRYLRLYVGRDLQKHRKQELRWSRRADWNKCFKPSRSAVPNFGKSLLKSETGVQSAAS
jgi:hypothetical protein